MRSGFRVILTGFAAWFEIARYPIPEPRYPIMSDSITAIRGTLLIDRTLVRDAVVIVRDGRIGAVGPADQIPGARK